MAGAYEGVHGDELPGPVRLVAAYSHHKGLVLKKGGMAEKGRSDTGPGKLAVGPMTLTGRVVTGDALHCRSCANRW